ncbi:MAG: PilZ domain-containing protein [Vicinamibacterales bacterium]
MTADVILVAPADLLPALSSACAPLGTVQAFPDTDALAALDATFQWLPREVVLERGFAESSRGRAFLRRVTDDAFARECLIRILDAASADHLPQPAVPAEAPAVDPSGTPADGAPDPAADAGPAAPRATPRLGVAPDTRVMVDGAHVTLVDLSMDGMQTMGALPLKPNQAVRVTLPDGAQGLRVRARVAWATLELGGAAGPRYRAGFAFVDADRAALEPVVARLTAAQG